MKVFYIKNRRKHPKYVNMNTILYLQLYKYIYIYIYIYIYMCICINNHLFSKYRELVQCYKHCLCSYMNTLFQYHGL